MKVRRLKLKFLFLITALAAAAAVAPQDAEAKKSGEAVRLNLDRPIRMRSTLRDFSRDHITPELANFVHRRTKELLPRAWKARSSKVSLAILDTAEKLNVDPLLLMSMIMTESRFKPEAVGRHGEIGLIQVKPTTAQWLLDHKEGRAFGLQERVRDNSLQEIKRALKDPATNLAFGAAYLAQLKRTFPGRGMQFLTAYNMGAVNLKSRLRAGYQPHVYKGRIARHFAVISRQFYADQAQSRRSIASLSSTFGWL